MASAPGFQVHPLDLHFLDRPEGIASFLVIGPGRPVLVETGPGSTVRTLERALAQHALRPADIQDVLVTHIHLDHAGAAGWWARQGARVHVHHVGAPHLIDPSKLLASARRIYGDAMEALWGEFLPVPPERVRPLKDGDVVEAGGLRFTALDTPGHARHHLVYQLEDVGFTGDLAGIRLAGRRHVRLPTPPPEFELEAWLASIKRVRGRNLDRLYLTHFGAVEAVAPHWAAVEALLPAVTEEVRTQLEQGAERDAIVAHVDAWERARQDADHLDEAGRVRYAHTGPVGMSVDGLIRYWTKRRGGASGA